MSHQFVNKEDVIEEKTLNLNLIAGFLAPYPDIDCLQPLRSVTITREDVVKVIETPDLYEQLNEAGINLKVFSRGLYETAVSMCRLKRSPIVTKAFCKITTPGLVYNTIMSYIYNSLKGGDDAI